MKFTLNKAITVGLLTGALANENYQTNYEVSRTGKSVKYVFQLGAQGSHTPNHSMGWAKDADEEPKQFNYVTPLGVRQQYMVGNELRFRYVEESKFIDDLYNIEQPFLQTSWNDTSILSAQAMMLGIYPPGKNNYKLEESQKYNAVPPIEGFDFKPWIDEMGLEALPYQTTIFPIQMNGWSYDYMLALDDINCPKRSEVRSTVKDKKDEAIKDAINKNEVAGMQSYVDKIGFENVCGYVNWAWTESVDLIDAVENKTPLEKMHSACQAAEGKILDLYSNLEDTKMGQVSSNDVRQRLMNQIFFWIKNLPGTSDAKKAEMEKLLNGVSLKTTAGSENPNYVLFWTNEQLLSLFAKSLSKESSSVNFPLVPSSQIILEFTQAENGPLTVSGFINDQEVPLVHCNEQKSCNAEAFALSIKDSLKVTDVSKWCGYDKSKASPEFTQ